MRGPHPFPARMAPDLALEMVQTCGRSPVLDPMCGSGTVLRAALDADLDAVGFDVDPLAVLMSKVWVSSPSVCLKDAAISLVSQCAMIRTPPTLPWIDEDPETKRFVEYWFSRPQSYELRKIADLLRNIDNPHLSDVLRLALSRTIVTKDAGASLARDVSHSRPHRTKNNNDYDVFRGFVKAAEFIDKQLRASSTHRQCRVELGDARCLPDVAPNTVGTIVTSPPYLNAIDYLRGHRLALVWLGYRVSELRSVRGGSIGAERGLPVKLESEPVREILTKHGVADISGPLRGMLSRYVYDLILVMGECQRVLVPGGDLLLIVGNSTVRGHFIDNASLVVSAAANSGFMLCARHERELPASRRYLPPPRQSEQHGLAKRMRTEVVLSLRKVADPQVSREGQCKPGVS